MSTLTYDSDRLIREWRERYTGRRTINRQMLDEAEILVRDAIVREREQETRQAKTEREHGQWQMGRLQVQLAEAKAKIESLSTRATLMREERETVETGTVVRLIAPTVPTYGDQSAPRPWMLVELEDVLLRLRMAGGADSTEVRFKRDAIEACVPFPEAALMPIAGDEPGRLTTHRKGVNQFACAYFAALAVVAALVALVGVWWL